MSLRERIEWVFRIGLLVFILAAAAFLSAVTTMRFAIQGREVSMPNLVGKSSADAMAILQGRGLQLKVVDRVYSDLPANAVARQSPPEGERMKVGQNAHVVLSLGSPNVNTPSLVGESLRVARIQLLQVGLQLGEVTTIAAPAAMSDTILQQTPLPGTRAASPRVDLLVAQGDVPASYVMPWMVGMSLPDADRLLMSAGIKLAKTTFVPSPQWPKGSVTEQIPDAGTKITSDSDIQIVVAQ
ncbi:MAG TPA: PASTA domain-containing protein [Candidatus Acidoferrales bacterium]|nr:PASTA domain-containing protein [Candidatus Acidoferrales bacterium]